MPNLSAPSGDVVEIISVVFAAFLVWASALAQHFSNVSNRGPGYAMSDRAVAPEQNGFYGRATRTLANNIESALMYAPPTLVLIALGKAGAVSHYAAAVYIVVRATFTITYWLRIQGIRSIAWLVGMIVAALMYYLAIAAAFAR
jgi:uncharacterized MAPEG superfamily protein